MNVGSPFPTEERIIPAAEGLTWAVKVARRPPWDYTREEIPSRFTLASWRRVAVRLAKEKGALTACGICKRPLHSYGRFMLKHPRSLGKSRKRKICIICADLLTTMLDVLEWHGASDNLPAEIWHDPRLQDPEGNPKDG